MGAHWILNAFLIKNGHGRHFESYMGAILSSIFEAQTLKWKGNEDVSIQQTFHLLICGRIFKGIKTSRWWLVMFKKGDNSHESLTNKSIRDHSGDNFQSPAVPFNFPNNICWPLQGGLLLLGSRIFFFVILQPSFLLFSSSEFRQTGPTIAKKWPQIDKKW